MITVAQVAEWMDELAPPHLAEEWDNIGLQCGRPDRDVKRIMTALTLTPDVLRQADRGKVDIIVSHHPVIFRPAKSIVPTDRVGSLLYNMIQSEIALFACHTNLDAAPGGVNDGLARRLQLKNPVPLVPGNDSRTGLGRVGELGEAAGAEEFLSFVQNSLNLPDLRCAGARTKRVKRVAVLGGAGASYLDRALEVGVDAFVTGDVDYHDADEALWAKILLVDAGHFGTECHVPIDVARYLKERIDQVGMSTKVTVADEEDAFWFHR